jgi:uncharacterized protein (TIGR03437 family)
MGAAVLFACGWWPLPASAALLLSLDGTTVYDTVNNVTWLADANLAASSRFVLPLCTAASGAQPCVNPEGSMNYPAAAAWVAAMNAANYLGHSNWQLPTTPLVDNTCPKTGPNGASFGFGCANSAMGSLYNALGLKAPNTAVPIPSNTAGPFSNFQPYLYWSQTSDGAAGYATFSFNTGFHGTNTGPNFMYVLPMIPGKIPGTPAATGTGLQVNPGGQTIYDPQVNVTWVANANLAASNTFGLPSCTDPVTPALCVDSDGAMSWNSASQFIANMNAYNGTGYLGQKNWVLPPLDLNCPNYGCGGAANPMGNLFHDQLGLSQGIPVVTSPNIAVGPFHNMQPYLYWGCQAATIESACQTDGPVPNFEWSFSFGSGFQGTDILKNSLYVTAYFAGPPTSTTPIGGAGAPQINAPGITNAASFASGSLVPGSIATIFGTNLTSSAGINLASGLPLPAQFLNVAVSVNGIPAPIFAVDNVAGQQQINFQTPWQAEGHEVAAISVTSNGVAGAAIAVPVLDAQPGIFAYSAGGSSFGAILQANYQLADSAHPASAGETVLIYCTGLGPVSPAQQSGYAAAGAASTTATPKVTIGGVPASTTYSGLAPDFVGLYQINAVVPSGLGTGNKPVVITTGSVASKPALLPVQ